MHRRLLDDITSLRLDGSGMSVSLVLRFLQEWLVRHVDGADRDFAVCWHDGMPHAAAGSE
ncbi:MAG: hypothetical protein M0Z28_12375 [Rhodospirillales bacterium]|nr:hypothetical protein [Rhodospirillales bacterium]